MATKNYQYRALTEILQGGYDGENPGVEPPDNEWHTTTQESGSLTYDYYYRDSWTTPGTNNYSSRVDVRIQDDWTASVNSRNYLTITVHSKILSIVRSDVKGASGASGVVFTINIGRDSGSPIASMSSGDIAIAGTISGAIDLGTYTFTLAPGSNLYRGTIYYKNQGYNDADEMYMGISFKNILPPDYRPGWNWNGSLAVSHNRSGGAANVRGGSGNWIEMRTEGGNGSTGGNPPYIYNGSNWANMREIGAQ